MYLDQEIAQSATRIGDQLLQAEKMLITAESCTGGLIGAECTNIAGSSTWFYGGIISYDNKAKETILGVSTTTLATTGAVSEETVAQMCRGALLLGGDISVAVSGVAGPAGGSKEKPVGTVVIGWMQKGEVAKVKTFYFEGDRTKVRELTVLNALNGIALLLDKK